MGIHANKSRGRPDAYFRLRPLPDRIAALYVSLAPIPTQTTHPYKGKRAVNADLSPEAFKDAGIRPELAEEYAVVTAKAREKDGWKREEAARKERSARKALIVGLADPTSTPLPEGWRVASVKEFRIAFLRAMKLANRVRGCQSAVGYTIGLDRTSAERYLRPAGVDIVKFQPFGISLTDPETAESVAKQEARAVHGKLIELVVSHPERNDEPVPYKPGMVGAVVAAAEKVGATVKVICRPSHEYVARRDATPPLPRNKPKAHRRGCTAPNGSRRRLPHSEPRIPAVKRPGFDPAWIEGHIAKTLRDMGYSTPNGKFFNPITQEIIPADSDAPELMALLLGRGLHEVALHPIDPSPVQAVPPPKAVGDDFLSGWIADGGVVISLVPPQKSNISDPSLSVLPRLLSGTPGVMSRV